MHSNAHGRLNTSMGEKRANWKTRQQKLPKLKCIKKKDWKMKTHNTQDYGEK